MIFGKYINRYYLRHAPALLLGILSLLMVDYIQLLVPQLYRLGINGVHHHVHRRRAAFLHGNYGAVYCKDLHGGKAAPALYCCGEQPCRSDSD